MEKELEEAAERLQKDKYGIFISKDSDVKGQLVIDTAKAAFLSGMNEGAKWQQDMADKKYTEEDVIDLFRKFGIENRNIPEDAHSWIELKSEHIEEWIHNKLNKQD